MVGGERGKAENYTPGCLCSSQRARFWRAWIYISVMLTGNYQSPFLKQNTVPQLQLFHYKMQCYVVCHQALWIWECAWLRIWEARGRSVLRRLCSEPGGCPGHQVGWGELRSEWFPRAGKDGSLRIKEKNNRAGCQIRYEAGMLGLTYANWLVGVLAWGLENGGILRRNGTIGKGGHLSREDELVVGHVEHKWLWGDWLKRPALMVGIGLSNWGRKWRLEHHSRGKHFLSPCCTPGHQATTRSRGV